MATKKKATTRKSADSKARSKVKKVMHEYKHGELKSGGSGRKVKSRKQAVAIALSEARESGARIPKKSSTSKSSAKNSSTKKAASRKKTSKKR